ncbi:MAG TPA: bifunctional hydroxymethylpyrimidine kinase/phosphomethylpyrimidine kinase [Chthoniobacterales bacterium]|nr:bifunctional hydroxymethylpyrimidine kinase/phosphomethylpyrimidine kinase [Chthoniobacterales bacterium]
MPVALTIAGSDSSAGAGIQADLKTFSALGVYGLTAVTCVVAETPGRVSEIEPVSAELVREQIEVLLCGFPVAAIKTGLLFSAEIISEIARTLREHRSLPLVIDPVMVATSGDALLQDDAIEIYQRDLFPLATLLTPNLNEAERLVGQPIADLAAMREAGEILVKKYGVGVLLKGGHLAGDQAIDLLFLGGNVIEFSAPFSRGVATHGTGCTYSAAITAGLASGLSIDEAVRRAKEFVSATIAQHHAWGGIHALNHLPL